MNDIQARIMRGYELAGSMTDDQNKTVDDACTRVRMGKSGYWHELAELVIERDAALKLLNSIDKIMHTMMPRYCGHPSMDGRYPCWIVWLPKEGTCERKTLKEAIIEFADQALIVPKNATDEARSLDQNHENDTDTRAK